MGYGNSVNWINFTVFSCTYSFLLINLHCLYIVDIVHLLLYCDLYFLLRVIIFGVVNTAKAVREPEAWVLYVCDNEVLPSFYWTAMLKT